MEKLIAGLAEFQKTDFQKNKALFKELANKQEPETLFITCSDSRIDPNLITQTDPGDLFICRNAGNIVPPHSLATGGMTASIEFAVMVLGVKHIVICGHTDCGAMKGAMNPESVATLPHVSNWLSNCSAALEIVKARNGELSHEHLAEMTQENVLMQIKHLATHPLWLPKWPLMSLTSMAGFTISLTERSVVTTRYSRNSSQFKSIMIGFTNLNKIARDLNYYLSSLSNGYPIHD